MTTEKPKWYSNLTLWREENGATGDLWDIYVEVIKEKLSQYRFWYSILGIFTGILFTTTYYYLRG